MAKIDPEESYRRYKQYMNNRNRYKMNQVAFPIAVLIIIGIVSKLWKLMIAVLLFFIIYKILTLLENRKKTNVDAVVSVTEGNRKVESAKMNKMSSTENGYVNKNNQRNNGRTDAFGTDCNQNAREEDLK